MSSRNTVTWTAAVLAVTFCISACQSGDTKENATPAPTERSNCLGFLNQAGTKAAAGLLGTDSYLTSAAPKGTAGAAKEMVSEYRANGVTEAKKIGLCWIYRTTKDLSDVTITSSFASEVPDSSAVASAFTPYKMGELALASSRKAVVYLSCSSERFEADSSRRTTTLRVEASNRYEPDGSPEELRKDNLTITHSVALALAEGLGCENNADLPSAFKMPPAA